MDQSTLGNGLQGRIFAAVKVHKSAKMVAFIKGTGWMTSAMAWVD